MRHELRQRFRRHVRKGSYNKKLPQGFDGAIAVGGRVFECLHLSGPWEEDVPGFLPPDRSQNKKGRTFVLPFRTPPGARTLDPNIKSVVLYQLS